MLIALARPGPAQLHATPLFCAAAAATAHSASGGAQCCEALVASGAQVDCRMQHQCTPLHVAAACGRSEALRALVRLGASVDALDKARPLIILYHGPPPCELRCSVRRRP